MLKLIMLVNIPYVSCPLFAVSVVLFVDLLKLLALALVPLGSLGQGLPAQEGNLEP